ncbi:MAG TPA: carboxypeptidase-like regulatory domain-containing protein, partial [Thermoanaerobaculia bacterium]
MTKSITNGRKGRAFSWAVALAAALGAAPAGAQVRGLVVDRSERPVADALVELWASSRRAAGTRTDDQGRFEIPGGPAEGQLMLTVRRLGLATQTVSLASRDTTVRVVMDVQAVSLRPLTVETAAGRLCPRREEPRARELWTRM